MNLVGKIFAVIIPFAATIFMAFAIAVYATHKNWKEAVEKPETGFKAQIEKKKQELADLEKTRDLLAETLSKETTEKRQAIAKEETYRAAAEEKITRLTQERDELDKKQQEAIAAMAATQQNLDKLTTEVEGLRTNIRETQADRDKQFAQVVSLTDQMHQAMNATTRLKERNQQLAQDNAQLKHLAFVKGISLDPSDTPPPLRGKVLAVNQQDMLEVSLGSDDGLHEGNTLEVYRGNNYLGRMRVMKTDSDRAVGKIIPDFKKGTIQKGDDVATRFKVG